MVSFRSIRNTQCPDGNYLEPLWPQYLPRNFTQCNVDMSDSVQTSTSCANPLACTHSGCCRFAITANQSEGGRSYSLDRSHLSCVIWGRWQVLIYLFRERTDNRALTMDVTGRNIPPVTSSTVWLFVETINTHKLPPRWDTAYLRYAVRQVR